MVNLTIGVKDDRGTIGAGGQYLVTHSLGRRSGNTLQTIAVSGQVILTALPDPGYRFTGWTYGVGSNSSNPWTTTFFSNTTVYAVFALVSEPPPQTQEADIGWILGLGLAVGGIYYWLKKKKKVR